MSTVYLVKGGLVEMRPLARQLVRMGSVEKEGSRGLELSFCGQLLRAFLEGGGVRPSPVGGLGRGAGTRRERGMTR